MEGTLFSTGDLSVTLSYAHMHVKPVYSHPGIEGKVGVLNNRSRFQAITSISEVVNCR